MAAVQMPCALELKGLSGFNSARRALGARNRTNRHSTLLHATLCIAEHTLAVTRIAPAESGSQAQPIGIRPFGMTESA